MEEYTCTDGENKIRGDQLTEDRKKAIISALLSRLLKVIRLWFPYSIIRLDLCRRFYALYSSMPDLWKSLSAIML